MKRIGYCSLVLAALALAGIFVGDVAATPVANGAVILTRIFNDCPVSLLNTINNYPALVQFEECQLICPLGWANLHNWTFSADGGMTQMVLNNSDSFCFGARLVLNGNTTNGAEAGLRLSPWWSQQVDGRFNVRIYDGEIACFGGVLPFYSFTANHGVVYHPGQSIYLEICYDPRSNTATDPALIRYHMCLDGNQIWSPWLPFGNCTPGEEIHGCYGIMDDARAGGYNQNRVQDVNQGCIVASFFDIYWQTPPVAAHTTTWGAVKAAYR